jgi:hypothetical protein
MSRGKKAQNQSCDPAFAAIPDEFYTDIQSFSHALATFSNALAAFDKWLEKDLERTHGIPYQAGLKIVHAGEEPLPAAADSKDFTDDIPDPSLRRAYRRRMRITAQKTD